MIIPTFVRTREDGVNLYQRKSDQKVKLLQEETGNIYNDPIDIDPCPYTYSETDIPIDEGIDPTSEIEQKAEAYDYLTGRSEPSE